MKTKTLLLALIPILAILSCNTTKKTPTGKESYTPEMQKIINEYPEMIGFEKRAIFLSKLKPEEEKEMKIEIIPGRQLYVDCNEHGLQGKLYKRTLEKNGYSYFLFNSNGEIYSTQMACPDDSRKLKFVIGETLMTDYRSDLPLVVYTSQFFEVRYSLWIAGEMYSVKTKNNGTLATEEAMSNSRFFPENEGFDRHVLYLPALESDEEINRKVEIIPGKMFKIDCNHHSLTGSVEEKSLEGFGFGYWVFNTDGTTISTKMGCPGQELRDEFVKSETRMLRYNSRIPIVVYTPKGYEINYKIWETNGKMY